MDPKRLVAMGDKLKSLRAEYDEEDNELDAEATMKDGRLAADALGFALDDALEAMEALVTAATAKKST